MHECNGPHLLERKYCIQDPVFAEILPITAAGFSRMGENGTAWAICVYLPQSPGATLCHEPFAWKVESGSLNTPERVRHLEAEHMVYP